MDRGTDGKRASRLDLEVLFDVHGSTFDGKEPHSLCESDLLHAFIGSKRRLLAAKAVEPRTSNLKRRTGEASGFTLIEILTVIAIITILASITMLVSGYARRMAVEERIRVEIRGMQAAIENYKAEYGAYPPVNLSNPLDASAFDNMATNFSAIPTFDGGWTNSHYLYMALSGANSPKIYFNFLPKQLTNVTVGGIDLILVLDPLGKPYGYNPRAPAINAATFDLFSAGWDSQSLYPTNAGLKTDDIGNWQR